MASRTQLGRRLNTFTSLYNIKGDVILFTNSQIERILRKFDSELNDIRDMNLKAFLLTVVGEYEAATEECRKALEKDKDSITALTNKAWLLYKQKLNFQEIEELCSKVEHLQKERPAVVLIARSEQAYAYGRISANFYQKAIVLYNEVIIEAERLLLEMVDEESKQHWKDNIITWKFGRVLLEIRRLKLVNRISRYGSSIPVNDYVSVIQRLLGLIEETSVHGTPLANEYKANTYVRLAEEVNNLSREKLIDKVARKMPNLKTDPLVYIDLALHDEEYVTDFVLSWCGKLLRYKNQIDRSIELLKRAIALKSTSFAHHHLALSLKTKVNEENNNRGFQKQKLTYPWEVQPIRITKEKLQEIVHHFTRAFKISLDYVALSAKAFLYRQSGRLEEAREVYQQVIQNVDNKCSILDLALAYENISYCLWSLKERTSDSEQRQRLETDIYHYVIQAIRLYVSILKRLPHHAMSGVHEVQTIKVLCESNAENDSSFNKQIRISLNKLYQLHLKNWENRPTGTLFESMLCLPVFGRVSDEERARCNDTIIDWAVDALKAGQNNIAKAILELALDAEGYWEEDTVVDTDDENLSPDLFMICASGSEPKWMPFVQALRASLNTVSINFDDAIERSDELDDQYIRMAIEKSKYVAVIVDGSNLENFTQYFGQLQDNSIVIRESAATTIPEQLQRLPYIDIQHDAFHVPDTVWTSDNTVRQMKLLFNKLAGLRKQ